MGNKTTSNANNPSMEEMPQSWKSVILERVKKELPFTATMLCPFLAFSIGGVLENYYRDLLLDYAFANILVYAFIMTTIWLITRNRRVATISTVVFSLLFGLVAHYVLRFRGRGFIPADILSWRTAANVAGGYDFSPDVDVYVAIIATFAFVVFLSLCIPKEKSLPFPKKWKNILLFVTPISILMVLIFVPVSDSFPAVEPSQWRPQEKGTLFNSILSIRQTTIQKPRGYEQEKIEAIIADYDTFTANQGDYAQPENIIVIMDEAYSDLSLYPSYEAGIGEDPYEYIHTISENAITGTMYAPVTGGGTATTECEFLTGLPTFPTSAVTYMMYADESMPSFAGLANVAGYKSTAFHPYLASGWNREVVYECMDFDVQLYDDAVSSPHLIRNFISDISDVEKVIELTEASSEKHFVFNVTMQNHSPYDEETWSNLPISVQPSESMMEADPNVRQYLCLMAETDRAIEKLVEHYKTSDERTLIVFFGDHQPSLDQTLFETLMGKPKSGWSNDEALLHYATPFFIWANYDIEEQSGVEISTNFLGTLVAEVAGLPKTGFMTYLDELRKDIPVISSEYVKTKDGICYPIDEVPEPYKSMLTEYELLNYCALADQFDEAKPFFNLLQE